MTVINIKVNSREEIIAINSAFVNWTIEDREKKWRQWVIDFASTTCEEEYYHRYDYFRFFTITTWDDLLSRDVNFVIDSVISRQIPMALSLDYNVFDKICIFLYSQVPQVNEMKNVFQRMRASFMASEAVIGMIDDSPYTLAAAIKDYSLVRSHGRDAIELADLMDKIKQMMFPKGDEFVVCYLSDKPDVALERLFDIIDFFIDIEPRDIYTTVNLYLHPGMDENLLIGTAQISDAISTEEVEFPRELSVLLPKTDSPKQSNDIVQNQISTQKPMPQTLIKPTPAEIRTKIDAAFEKDEKGNYKDLDGVFIVLGRAAQKYNDPTIAELYYFDETTDEFKWNV